MKARITPSQTQKQAQAAMHELLHEIPEDLQYRSGLVRRQRQVTGPNLAQTCVLGWLEKPEATLEELVQFAAQAGLKITAQGLDERFNATSVCFFKQVFEYALTRVVTANPVGIPLLQRFGAVIIEDSTSVALPEELSEQWRSCSGKVHGQGVTASCKLFLRLDLLKGRLQCSEWYPGRMSDARSPFKGEVSGERTLHIRDRGFLDIGRWSEEEQRGEYNLSYLKSRVALRTLEGERIDLLSWVKGQQRGDDWVIVGDGTQRMRMRLIFQRVPDEVATERRRAIERDAVTHQRPASAEVLELAAWSIAVTNVPEELMNPEEALILLRLRWQIEVVIKEWKSIGKVDEWRTHKIERIQTEIYAKLIAGLIRHWIVLVYGWQDPMRSWLKSSKSVRGTVKYLLQAFHREIRWKRFWEHVQQALENGCTMQKRRKVPNSVQMALSGENIFPWPTRPWKEYRK